MFCNTSFYVIEDEKNTFRYLESDPERATFEGKCRLLGVKRTFSLSQMWKHEWWRSEEYEVILWTDQQFPCFEFFKESVHQHQTRNHVSIQWTLLQRNLLWWCQVFMISDLLTNHQLKYFRLSASFSVWVNRLERSFLCSTREKAWAWDSRCHWLMN